MMLTTLLLDPSSSEALVPSLVAALHAIESSPCDFVAFIAEVLQRE